MKIFSQLKLFAIWMKVAQHIEIVPLLNFTWASTEYGNEEILKIEKTLAQIWVLQEATTTSLKWNSLHYSEFISYPWMAPLHIQRQSNTSNFNAFAIFPSKMCALFSLVLLMYYVWVTVFNTIHLLKLAPDEWAQKDMLHVGEMLYTYDSIY